MGGNYNHMFEWQECFNCGIEYLLEDFEDEGMEYPEDDNCVRCTKKALRKLQQSDSVSK